MLLAIARHGATGCEKEGSCDHGHGRPIRRWSASPFLCPRHRGEQVDRAAVAKRTTGVLLVDVREVPRMLRNRPGRQTILNETRKPMDETLVVALRAFLATIHRRVVAAPVARAVETADAILERVSDGEISSSAA